MGVKKDTLYKVFCWEFHISRFCLTHHNWRAFAYTPWLPLRVTFQWIYLIYRWIMVLFFIAHLLWYMIDGVEGIGYFFIYLTNWGYMLVTAYLTWSALSVTLRYLQQSLPACEKFQLKQQTKDDIINNEMSSKPKGCSGCTHNSLQWYEIIHWILFLMSGEVSFIITVLYWSLLYRPNLVFIYYDLTAHLFNSLVVLVDMWITRIPVRIYHFFFSMIFASVYILFTGFYYVGGGGNPFNNNTYIYPVLDYDTDPGFATGLSVGVILVVLPLVHLIFYCIYLLREGLLYLVKTYCCNCLEDNEKEHSLIPMKTFS